MWVSVPGALQRNGRQQLHLADSPRSPLNSRVWRLAASVGSHIETALQGIWRREVTMLKVYLDNCVLNRPFDDQSQIRIKLETEAKFYIQTLIKQHQIVLVWSYILELENAHNPYVERRSAIEPWQKLAQIDISETESVLSSAHFVQAIGLKSKDALHIACAIESAADYFITTDDLLIKKAHLLDAIRVINPLDFIDCMGEVA
jgi:predicted nucleic acid-binding protein